jgi:hypothetical protein
MLNDLVDADAGNLAATRKRNLRDALGIVLNRVAVAGVLNASVRRVLFSGGSFILAVGPKNTSH